VAESNHAVYAALAGNVAIACTKFAAAALSGSPAMLAEAFHSTVDSADSLLLLYGRHRSRRPPDVEHPFGYGQELYFWTFVVAIMIFAVGGGFAVYEGVLHLLHQLEVHGHA
jgi:cation diffusion facilitator family transporter